MKIFQCNSCSQPIFFENTACEKCGALLGYFSDTDTMVSLTAEGDRLRAALDPSRAYRYCANGAHGVCNWLVHDQGGPSLCTACELNGTIPDLGRPGNIEAWRKLEFAKHRLVYSLLRLGLPPETKARDPETGLAFHFLSGDPSDASQPVVRTGHFQGDITIDVAEADDARREKSRQLLGEPYRTLIGHFRHEIGHYYWERLIRPVGADLRSFRDLFGDERAPYPEAIQRHYDQGPPADWRGRFATAYASAHPWEDWAETWAHFFHLVDTLETAHAFRIRLDPDLNDPTGLRMQADFDPYLEADFDAIVAAWLPLTFAINSLNRSMGQPDLYPFVLLPSVMEKLRFVHGVVQRRRTR